MFARIWAIIATFIAVLGWFDQIKSSYEWAFGKPKFVIIDNLKLPKNVTVEKKFLYDLKIKNIQKAGNSSITVSLDGDATVEGIGSLSIVEKVHSAVEPNKMAIVKIIGIASKTGQYKIPINLSVKCGFLRKANDKKITVLLKAIRQVQISKEKQSLAFPAPDVCSSEFLLLPGEKFPKGLWIQAFLEGAPNVVVFHANFPKINGSIDMVKNIEKQGEEVSTIIWKSSEIKEIYEPIKFNLFLRQVNRDRQVDWENAIKKVQFDWAPISN